MNTKLFSLITALTIWGALLITPVSAQTVANPNDFTFELNDNGDGYIVTGYNGPTATADEVRASLAISNKVLIPDVFNGKPVTEIAPFFFQKPGVLQRLFIPSSITKLHDHAFEPGPADQTVAITGYIQQVVFIKPEPPIIGNKLFANVWSEASLFVPKGSKDAYKSITAAEWQANMSADNKYTEINSRRVVIFKDGVRWADHGKTISLVKSDGSTLSTTQYIFGSEIFFGLSTTEDTNVYKVYFDGEDSGMTLKCENGGVGAAYFDYYPVTYDANGATGDLPQEEIYLVNDRVSMNDQGNLELDGHTFGGWKAECILNRFITNNDLLSAKPAGTEFVMDYAPVTLKAQWEITEGDFTFAKNGDEYTLIKYNGSTDEGTVINIPSTVNDKPVTKIGEKAFSVDYCGYRTTTVIIPASIISIDDKAFDGERGTYIKEAIFLSSTPPSIKKDVFAYTWNDDFMVYVPKGSLSAYSMVNSTTWQTDIIGAGKIAEYGVSVIIKKDGEVWADHGKTIALDPEAELMDVENETVFFAKNQEYDILVDDEIVSSVTVENYAGEATVDYYTVTYTADDAEGEIPVDDNAYISGSDFTVLDGSGLTKDGNIFDGWTNEDGNDYAAGETVTIDQKVTLTAKWKQTYKIIKSAIANGTVSVTVDDQEADTAEEGQTVKLTIAPARGYELASITVSTDDATQAFTATTATTREFTMPAEDVTVSASFRLIYVPNPGTDGGSNNGGTTPTTDPEWSALQEAISIISSAKIEIPQAKATTKAAAEEWLTAYVKELLKANNFNGISINYLSVFSFNEAVAGTKSAVSGSNGSLIFDLILANKYTQRLNNKTAAITATSFVGNEAAQAIALKTSSDNGILHISGLRSGEMLMIYNISGSLVYKSRATAGEINITLPRGIYIATNGRDMIKAINK